MGVRQRAAIVAALVFACVSGFGRQTLAQSLYAAGAVGADIALVSGQESIGFTSPTGGGEALSGAARLGTVFNDRFGVELEVSRAGEIRNSSRSGGPIPLGAAFPIFLPEINVHTRVTTVSATASIRQQVADSVALLYLGGVVFHRTDSRVEYRGGRILPTLGGATPGVGFVFSDVVPNGLSPVGIALPLTSVESVRYGAGPVVGFEAHIGYGEHVMIIPGVRMHSLPASWLLRPSVAAGWRF
jgi:hypothetical protein